MNIVEHFHRLEDSPLNEQLIDGVRQILLSYQIPLSTRSKGLREDILQKLGSKGWSNAVRIDQRSKINITSVLNDTGLCLQTGNMSRYYADLLKLDTLYKKNLIKGGIYILPIRSWSKELGKNRAHYERFVEELKIFDETITVPLVVFGLTGRN